MAQNQPMSLDLENERLQYIVATAWVRTNVSQTQFAQMLRNEAKIVGHYHDPGAGAQDASLREELQTYFKNTDMPKHTIASDLRTLAKGYENAPETGVAAVNTTSRR